MPEGPEIFLAARRVHEAVAEQPSTVKLLCPTIAAKARSLRGVPIKRVHARSKAMLTEFANGIVLYSHNQLYGEWMVHAAGEPLLKKQVRLIITTAQHQTALYSATDFAWLRAGKEEEHPYIAKLGPEVLSSEVSPIQIAHRLAQFPRRFIADALLDQHVLAGLGNYLRADILLVAKINPLRKISSLSPQELMRIARACKLLTQRSIQRQGVVCPWAQYTAARKSGADYEAARFYAFDREGAPCWECSTPIARITHSGRGLFFCPACQAS
ncbi:MAG: endonuclease VIII [Burkholderiales bacterium]|nr:MAG: endonuclease VIII [Burkholderiales bacterium]